MLSAPEFGSTQFDMDETVYTVLSVVSLLALVLCCIVIFRHRFCSPFMVLLVVAISLMSFGLLLSSLQRIAQHATLTIGILPIAAGEVLAALVLGYMAWDMRSRRPRKVMA